MKVLKTATPFLVFGLAWLGMAFGLIPWAMSGEEWLGPRVATQILTTGNALLCFSIAGGLFCSKAFREFMLSPAESEAQA